MAAKILEELRKLYANEANSSENDPQTLHKAMLLFKDELHPLFHNYWGEIWIERSGIDKGLNSYSAKLWITSLIGLDVTDLAIAINQYNSSGRSAFPPNAGQFRAICTEIRKLKEAKKCSTKHEYLN